MENLAEGTLFGSIKDAKESIVSFCVRNRHKYNVKQCCTKKYSVVCKVRGCGFTIACYRNRHEIVKVTKFVLDHSCGHQGGSGNVSANTAYIARKVQDLIAKNPAMKVVEVMAFMKQEDGIDVPYWAAWKGRRVALTNLYGSIPSPSVSAETETDGRPRRLRSRNIRGPGRKCSKCGMIAHHNARTCERRQQAALPPMIQETELPPIDFLEDESLLAVCEPC